MKKEVLLTILILVLLPAVLAQEEVSAAEEIIQQKISQAGIIAIIAGALASIAIIAYGISKKRHWHKIILNVVVIAAIVLIGFSLYYFTTIASEEEGITVCEAGQCFWAAHIHTELRVNICGKDIELGLEKGALEATHTHKEKNRLHFHERLPVDPATREITDFTPLQLDTFLEAINLPLTPGCIGDTCNCNGEPGQLSMTINGKTNTEFDKYIWKEGDIIEITLK